MMKTISFSAALRGLFRNHSFKGQFEDMEDIILDCFEKDVRGTLLTDLRRFTASFIAPKDKGHICAFYPDTAYALKRYFQSLGQPETNIPTSLHYRSMSHNNMSYSAARSFPIKKPVKQPHPGEPSSSTIESWPGDSQALIECGQTPIPVIILDIFSLKLEQGSELFLAVQRLGPSPATSNPFARYPVLDAALWSKTRNNVEVVQAKHLCCHFASCVWDDEHYVVVPLNRANTPYT